MEFVIDVDDEVVKMIDDEAVRRGVDRKHVMEQFISDGAASRKLRELFRPRSTGLSDEDAEDLVAAERRAMRAERRATRPPSS
jgi:hypothetical protein